MVHKSDDENSLAKERKNKVAEIPALPIENIGNSPKKITNSPDRKQRASNLRNSYNYNKISQISVTFNHEEPDEPNHIWKDLIKLNQEKKPTDENQRKNNLSKKRKSKLDKKNMSIKEFVPGDIIKTDKNNSQEIGNLSLTNNSQLELLSLPRINEESLDNTNNTKYNGYNCGNLIIENQNFGNVENFENFEILGKENNFKIFGKKVNKIKKIMIIAEKKRTYTLPIKNINKISCFVVNITVLKYSKVTNKSGQSMTKAFIILLLYVFMWYMMAVFINNLVEKYGSSTFSVCILPIFTMFLVKLIATANVQFFIMAVVLKMYGKSYLNIAKKPILQKILFAGLVHPMALDHYESILFYQEYLRYRKYKLI